MWSLHAVETDRFNCVTSQKGKADLRSAVTQVWSCHLLYRQRGVSRRHTSAVISANHFWEGKFVMQQYNARKMHVTFRWVFFPPLSDSAWTLLCISSPFHWCKRNLTDFPCRTCKNPTEETENSKTAHTIQFLSYTTQPDHFSRIKETV